MSELSYIIGAESSEISAITLDESKRLIALESTIKRGLNTFVEVGEALLEIRDSKLYRIEHGTFEEYCKEKWGMSRPRVYQLIGASETAKRVSTIVDVSPSRESQVRPLGKLEPEDQPKAWAKAVESAGGEQPTAKQVEAAASNIIEAEIVPTVAKKQREPKIPLSHKVVVSLEGEIKSIERVTSLSPHALTLYVTSEDLLKKQLSNLRSSLAAKVCKAIRAQEDAQ